jgi:hypothetical protein
MFLTSKKPHGLIDELALSTKQDFGCEVSTYKKNQEKA